MRAAVAALAALAASGASAFAPQSSFVTQGPALRATTARPAQVHCAPALHACILGGSRA